MTIIFIINFLLLILYSFCLTDPNLTFINNSFFAKIKTYFINFGYFQRNISALVFLFLILLLSLNYLIFLKKEKIDIFRLALLLALLSIFSYPFLSKDFFNYLFDAKILTFYGKNPYFYKPLDFINDSWLRFMHWTHRSYPYGPVFLLISLIPSFLAFGKFILNFLFFKIIWVFFYLLAVFLLQKINKKTAIIFAFHPLVLIEGLINNHNDLIAVSLGIAGIYFIFKNKNILGKLILILSAGVKYLTLPTIFLSKKTKIINSLILFLTIGLLFYLSFFKETQPWYFLNLFIFLPFLPKIINKINIFLIGIIFSYYPYLRFDFWNEKRSIILKHQIIWFFLFLNLFFLFFKKIVIIKNKKK